MVGKCHSRVRKSVRLRSLSRLVIKRQVIRPVPEPKLECDQCGKKFQNWQAMGMHRWAAHKLIIPVRTLVYRTGTAKAFTCFICKKVYKDQRTAQAHVQRRCATKLSEREVAEVLKNWTFTQKFDRFRR